MLELISIIVSTLADFYVSTDWGHASDFMSFVRETVGLFVLVPSLVSEKEKDDQGSGKP